jgi:hypothetical protein
VQAGGITLPGCSTSTSVCSSYASTGVAAAAAEDGLAQALQQALAAAAASTASTSTAAAAGGGTSLTAQGLVLPQLKQELLKQQQQQLAGVAEGGDLAAEEGPLSTGFSRVGAVPQQQQQQQLVDEGCDGEASGGAVSWLHTPDDPQQKQLQQQQQERLDLVGMPTVGVAARGAAVSKHLGARLAQLSQTQEEVSGQTGHQSAQHSLRHLHNHHNAMCRGAS